IKSRGRSPFRCMKKVLFAGSFFLAALGCLAGAETPTPSGPQSDGNFRKVVLDSDQPINGKLEDTLKDPMELAVAVDGRVFYAQRSGTIKMWKPDTKTTVEIAKIQVFSGLEDGMLGLTLDPNFAENGWIYL